MPAPTIQNRLRGDLCTVHGEQDECSFLALNWSREGG
jgi:hypothetical protein